MNLANKRNLLLLISAGGIAISLYLTYVKLTDSPIRCTVGSCDIVQKSKYAEILGIPVAVLGVIFYLSLAIVTHLNKRKLIKLWTIWGFIFSAYLTYLELFVIHEICQWCVLSAILATCALVFSFIKEKPVVSEVAKEDVK
jgi:uncharacterized membrane protein